ncbi:MAG: class I tRNA ligase family protein, partial [Candidatus Berkiellales bacterium]
TIKNVSAHNDLLILSIIIDDHEQRSVHHFSNKKLPFEQYLIISTPPTPNGDLHLGHLSGPYLKADVLRRFLFLNGVAAYHLTGQDNHQSYTASKAKTLGWDAESTAKHFGNEIYQTLTSADIKTDFFCRPESTIGYTESIQKYVLKLWEQGMITIKEASSVICKNCDRYLYEVYVQGVCPHCSTPTRGNFCEACGKINDCADLIEPKCSDCNTPATTIKLRRAYFNLSHFSSHLAEYLQQVPMSKGLREYCHEILLHPLPDVPVSHAAQWGIPCPIPSLEDQIISVWFEMGLGHLTMAQAFVSESNPEFLKTGLEFWQNENATLIYTFGFDNSFFNCFLFPATFMGLKQGLKPASSLYFNQFYCLKDMKFSTSRNHLVWAKDFLAQHSSDSLRYYLAMTSPEEQMTNFSMDHFSQVIPLFKEAIEDCLKRLDFEIQENCQGTIPYTGLWTDQHLSFYNAVLDAYEKMTEHYHPDTFSIQAAQRALHELLILIREALCSEFKFSRAYTYTDEYRTSVALAVFALKVLSLVSYPILPRTSLQLWEGLGMSQPMSWQKLPKLNWRERTPSSLLACIDSSAFTV